MIAIHVDVIRQWDDMSPWIRHGEKSRQRLPLLLIQLQVLAALLNLLYSAALPLLATAALLQLLGCGSSAALCCTCF